MPNGHGDYLGPERREYNPYWCREKHKNLDKRIDIIESRLWGIWILLFGNLFGVAATIVLLVMGNGG